MRLVLIFIITLSNKIYSQITPTTQGIYFKKSSSVSEESFVLDFDNDDDCTSGCGTSFYGEINWSRNMSEYTVSIWVKSGEDIPTEWRAFFNTYTDHGNGFQMDSGGSTNYRLNAHAGVTSFGANSLKTTWVHLAVVAGSSQTKLYYNGSLVSTNNWVETDWNQIEIGRNRNQDRPGNYFVDEIRVWDVALSQSNIQSWMHKPLSSSHPNYSDLEVYFQMNSNSVSGGNTLVDMSGKNNDATLNNVSGIQTSSSNVPVTDLISSYQTDVESIWSSTETSDSEDSDGLKMSVSSTLAEANFVIFGNNNDNSGTTSSDIVGISKRSKREWHFDESGTVTADVKIDISDATGHTGSTIAASNYKLLYASCSGCTFVELDTGDSTSGDVVTFSNVAIKDGIYSIASADSNL